MPEFDAADIRRYYDRHTDRFLAHGEGGSIGALHRSVWGPETTDASAAFHYVEDRILSHILALEQRPDPPHIVDLGCGVGASLCYLAQQFPIQGTGITLSPVQVHHAKNRIRKAGLSNRIVCHEGDYCDPPEDIAPADLVYAIESFVHGPDPSRFFAGCTRWLRIGGLLIICDDFRRPVSGLAAPRAIERFRRGWHLNTLLDTEELETVARTAGFEHVSTSDLTPYLNIRRPRDRAIALFIALFGWLPLHESRFGYLAGGSALQTCLAHGWIGYDLKLFRYLG